MKCILLIIFCSSSDKLYIQKCLQNMKFPIINISYCVNIVELGGNIIYFKSELIIKVALLGSLLSCSYI